MLFPLPLLSAAPPGSCSNWQWLFANVSALFCGRHTTASRCTHPTKRDPSCWLRCASSFSSFCSKSALLAACSSSVMGLPPWRPPKNLHAHQNSRSRHTSMLYSLCDWAAQSKLHALLSLARQWSTRNQMYHNAHPNPTMPMRSSLSSHAQSL